MSEIPEDVMMHAERLYDEGGHKTVPLIIAEAIMAERSRCYEIAMDLGNYDELSVAKAINGLVGNTGDGFALIPSEPNESEVKPSWQDPSIFCDAEGRN